MLENHIRKICRSRGLSQTKLANLAGLAESTLSDIELCKRLAWPKARKSLADALHCPEEELFPGLPYTEE